MHTHATYDTVVSMTDEPLCLVGSTFTFNTEPKEVVLSFDVRYFYAPTIPTSERDSFTCSKFRFTVKRGIHPRHWDYRILSCPDEDHDLYIVKGKFYLELVHQICGPMTNSSKGATNKSWFVATAIQVVAKPEELMKLLSS